MPRGVETVTVVRPAIKDRLGAVVRPAGEDFDIEGCQLIPRAVREEGGGWINIDGWDVWCLRGLPEPVDNQDRLRIRGEIHEIEGDPAVFDKRGVHKGTLIKTKRVG